MLKNRLIMSKIRQLLRLHTQGKSKMFIKEHTGLSRNTVKKYIKLFRESKLTYQELAELSDKDLNDLFGNNKPVESAKRLIKLIELLPDIDKSLKRKGATLELVWNDYFKAHPDGYRFTQFCKHYNDWKRQSNPVMHMEHKAGDKMFVDFAGEKMKIVDRQTGEEKEAEVFVAILGASQMVYVEATESQKKEDFITVCENAMHYYGGVPQAIVPDNLKSAVTKSDRYEPTVNETFEDFAEHYGTTILPARAYRPKDKALVEGMVKIIYRRIYTVISKETYFSLAELNEAIRKALEELNNTFFRGRDYSRSQQFDEIEKTALQPLPVNRYEFKKQQMVTVLKDGHVCLGEDKHYYSVPYRFIGKKVKIIYTKEKLNIYLDHECIASHDRLKGKFIYTTMPEHVASTHRYVTEWSAEKFIRWAEKVGPDAKMLVEQILCKKQHPEQSYKSCMGILRLAGKVGDERLNKACRMALEFGYINYKAVLDILMKNLDKTSPDDPDNGDLPPHDNIRGGDYFD
jgi:transposase